MCISRIIGPGDLGSQTNMREITCRDLFDVIRSGHTCVAQIKSAKNWVIRGGLGSQLIRHKSWTEYLLMSELTLIPGSSKVM